MVDGQPFVLWQRKGWPMARWEQVMEIKGCAHLCPWHLFKLYVALTAATVPAGTFVFRCLKPPFAPLTSNTIGSITKKALKDLGIPVDFWKAHSIWSFDVQKIGPYKRTSL